MHFAAGTRLYWLMSDVLQVEASPSWGTCVQDKCFRTAQVPSERICVKIGAIVK